MKKKLYISPISEIMNLRGMQAMMEAFGPASMPSDPLNNAPQRRNGAGPNRTPVF